MKKGRLASLLLAATLIAGGFVNSSTAAVTKDDYTEDELTSSSYDIRKYTDNYWEGNIVYNEVVFPIRNEDGSLPVFELMYEASEIVSVKNYRLNVTYEAGKDYSLVNGKLRILEGGDIRIINYDDIHTTKVPDNYTKEDFFPFYPHADTPGLYEYWTGGSDISDMTIAVTYIHNDEWEGPVPESQETELPLTMEKLKNKESMTIVVAGDSVSGGAMASGSIGIAPYADAYPEMTVKALRSKYGYDDIKLINSAIGGTMSTYDSIKVYDTIIKHNPDLVIINFGMNDSSCDRVGIPGEEFKSNIIKHVEYIHRRLPKCEILLVSSLYGNRLTFPAERYEEHAGLLHDVAKAYDGVGVADPQMVEKYLIEEVGKDFLCFMADNMVHPNDFGMRLTAQSILSALDISDTGPYKDKLIDDLTNYAKPDTHTEDGKKQELWGVINEAEADLRAVDYEWDINSIVSEAYESVDKILKRCAFEDHEFSHITTFSRTCKKDGYVHSVCSICEYEYDHDLVPALGGEHIMDSGRQTVSPTYKTKGEYTYSCVRCGYETHDVLSVLGNPPVLENQGMLHIGNNYNYMEADAKPYRGGSGYIEIDICPISIASNAGIPYIGVWFSNYTMLACYNFNLQQFEILSASMPYQAGTIYASAPYEWTPNSGEYGYNWKRFCVKISDCTVEMYIDGELILSDTDNAYKTTNEVGLVYSIGEFYMDNFKIGTGDYDPTTGEGGSVLSECDLNTDNSVKAFNSKWKLVYSEYKMVDVNAANVTTGKYVHNHQVSLLSTVESTCSLGGYSEYVCDICGDLIRLEYTEQTDPNGHVLVNRKETVTPTNDTPGKCTYECENCEMTFEEILPSKKGSIIIDGDVDGDGYLRDSDLVYMQRIIAGEDVEYDLESVDFDGDGRVTAKDASILSRKLEGAA